MEKPVEKKALYHSSFNAFSEFAKTLMNLVNVMHARSMKLESTLNDDDFVSLYAILNEISDYLVVISPPQNLKKLYGFQEKAKRVKIKIQKNKMQRLNQTAIRLEDVDDIIMWKHLVVQGLVWGKLMFPYEKHMKVNPYAAIVPK